MGQHGHVCLTYLLSNDHLMKIALKIHEAVTRADKNTLVCLIALAAYTILHEKRMPDLFEIVACFSFSFYVDESTVCIFQIKLK